MVALLFFLLRLLVSPFRSISRLEAENAVLRRQLIVLQRKVRGRVQFTNSDRLFFLHSYRWFPSIVEAMTTIRPETLVRWHRAGFRRAATSRLLAAGLVTERDPLEPCIEFCRRVGRAGVAIFNPPVAAGRTRRMRRVLFCHCAFALCQTLSSITAMTS